MFSVVPPKYVSVTVTVALYSPFNGETHFEGVTDTASTCAEATDGTTRNSAQAATVLLSLRMATINAPPCGLYVEHITAAEDQLFCARRSGRRQSFTGSVQGGSATLAAMAGEDKTTGRYFHDQFGLAGA